MKRLVSGKPFARIFALALILGSLQVSPVIGWDDGPPMPTPPKKKLRDSLFHKSPAAPQGFQGFGLGYHLGYGYGGIAQGAGYAGGYPLYGGPGYLHQAPALRRFGGIAPFCYYGGPGGPSLDHPNFFEVVGPLGPDNPVVNILPDSPYTSDYGPFTGMIPYPESTFAPYTSRAAGGSSEGTNAYRRPTSLPPRP